MMIIMTLFIFIFEITENVSVTIIIILLGDPHVDNSNVHQFVSPFWQEKYENC